MSRMRSFLKPPLPKSPIRLRSRQVLHSNSPSLQTPPPPGSVTKQGRRLSDVDLKPKLPYDYSTISNEIHALANMVKEEFSKEDDRNLESLAAKSVPVLERGRFYEEYSAKRNERLKRKKKGGGGGEVGTPYNLGVKYEPMSTKRRGITTTSKKLESFKKTTFESTMTPRYSLRSMAKENRKPPTFPLTVNVSGMKTNTTRRGRRL